MRSSVAIGYTVEQRLMRQRFIGNSALQLDLSRPNATVLLVSDPNATEEKAMTEAAAQDGWEYRLILGDKPESTHFGTYKEARKAQTDEGTKLYRQGYKFRSCLYEWKDGMRIGERDFVEG
jgi:hypothetical protein